MAASHCSAMRPFAIISIILVGLLVSETGGIARAKYGDGCISSQDNTTKHTVDVILEVGSSAYVDCVLNDTSAFKSDSLNWSKGFSQVIDSKTLRLNLNNARIADTGYRKCVNIEQEKGGVCVVKVSVGYKPKEILNFSCLSVNLEYLDCTWRKPVNPIYTNYSMVMTFYSGIIKTHPCAVKPRGFGVFGCNFTTSSCDNCPDRYDPYKPKFDFEVTGANVLGVQTWKYPFEHYSRVRPKEPMNFRATSISSRQLLLSWDPPTAMKMSGAPKLIYRVRHTSNWESEVKEMIVEETLADLTNLQPNTWYYFTVSGLSQLTNPKDELMWGPPAFLNVTTEPDVPDSAPQFGPGSFQVLSSFEWRDVNLYWKGIENWERNGDDFSYVVKGTTIGLEEEQEVFNCTKVEEGTTSFCNLSFHNAYKFTIHSRNAIGRSLQSSEVIVNRRDQMLEKPDSLTVIAIGPSLFNVSWVPKNSTTIERYVIYQASSRNQFRKNDAGLLSWTDVDLNTFNLIIPSASDLPYHHFGVAAYGHNHSSDLLWNTCIISHDGTMGKLKTITDRQVHARSISIGWSIDCSEKLGIIRGYNIDYCRVSGNSSGNCLDEQQTYFVVGADQDTASIKQLRPFSYYKVTVSAVTSYKAGEVSDPIYIRTDEDVPSDAGTEIQIYGITNTSFFLKWHPPVHPNGNLTKFVIMYKSSDGKSMNLNYPTYGYFGDQSTTHIANITEGLAPYTDYNVTLVACNKKGCSNESSPLSLKTSVGIPGQMDPPLARLYNSSHAVVELERYDKMNGPNPMWELKVAVVGGDDNDTVYEQIYRNYTDYDSMVYIPIDCENPSFKDKIIQLQTKSSNLVDGQDLEGPWSDYTKISCLSAQFPMPVVLGAVLGATIILTFVLLAAIVLTKKAKIYIKKITEVTVVMPSGLDYDSFSGNLKNTDKDNGYSTMDAVCGSSPSTSLLRNPSRVRNISNETTHSGSSTEELLLKDQSSKNNWANDSIASGNNDSLSSRPSTAQTHLSSDSSLELTPSVPESPDSVFNEHPLKNPATMTAQPTLSIQMQNGNFFNPTLAPIGESQDGSSSRNGTPQHYSKFAGYCDEKGPSPSPVSMQSKGGTSGYVAAPYSQFGLATDNPRAATFGGGSRGEPSWTEGTAPSYSKFGLGIPGLEDQAILSKANAASAPITSTPTRTSVGYSILGLGEEDYFQDDYEPAVPSSAGKGYVMAASLSDVNPEVIPSSSKNEDPGAGDSDPNYLPMNVDSDPAHKRSPSNSSSLTAGYCRFGLSRPTSMSSESGHYVPADLSSCPSPSKNSSCRTSVELPGSPYRDVGVDASVAEEHEPSAAGGAASSGYASVQQLLKSELNS